MHPHSEEQLTPENLRLLVDLAGPIFAESRLIERYTSDNPVHDGRPDDGSNKIKVGLEQMQRQVVQAPSQTFIPPQPEYMSRPDYIPSVTPVYHPPAYIPVEHVPTPTHSDSQLEFNFNMSEQKKTNELLESISKKLTKLISMIQLKQDDSTNISIDTTLS